MLLIFILEEGTIKLIYLKFFKSLFITEAGHVISKYRYLVRATRVARKQTVHDFIAYIWMKSSNVFRLNVACHQSHPMVGCALIMVGST